MSEQTTQRQAGASGGLADQEPAAGGPSHRVDALLGFLVAAIGAGFLIGAWAMPRFEHRNADPLTLPGITPGMLGLVILVLGLMLAPGDALMSQLGIRAALPASVIPMV